MQQVSSRRVLGLGTVIAASLIAEFLPAGPPPTSLSFAQQIFFVPAVWDLVVTLASFALGAYVSRKHFLPVATTFVALMWILGQYILYKIALPAGQADLVGIATGNVLSLFALLLTATLGTYAGEQLYRRRLSARLTH